MCFYMYVFKNCMYIWISENKTKQTSQPLYSKVHSGTTRRNLVVIVVVVAEVVVEVDIQVLVAVVEVLVAVV